MKELPPYPEDTVLVVEVGSGAHGTGLPGKDDHDETAIRIETHKEVFALRDHELRAVSQRTAPEGVPSGPEDTDRNIYTLRRFLNLATAGNPSIMLVFWGPLLQTSAIGAELRGLSSLFVGRHLIPKYRGYMQAQRDRLLGLRGGRHGAFRETEAGFDTKYAMHAARLGFQGIELLTTNHLTLPIRGAAGDWLRMVRQGKVSLDAVTSRIDELDRHLAELANDELIPPGPSKGTIVAWSTDTHLRYWNDVDWSPLVSVREPRAGRDRAPDPDRRPDAHRGPAEPAREQAKMEEEA